MMRYVKVLVILLASVGIFAQAAQTDWLGGFSSKEWEGSEEKASEDQVYYLWQLESLKKGLAPRYIRYLDIEHYVETGKLLNRGILFSFTGLRDESVEICGNFTNWECIPMKRNKFGVYFRVVEPDLITPEYELEQKYEYKFRVNGLFTFDPENQDRYEDGSASYISVFILPSKDVNKQTYSQVLEDSNIEEQDLRTVRFQAYSPNSESIVLLGNFNDWSPENDFLKKGRDGIFRLDKKLLPGTYHFYFMIDGEPAVDTYNPITEMKMDTLERVSTIVVEPRMTPLERKSLASSQE